MTSRVKNFACWKMPGRRWRVAGLKAQWETLSLLKANPFLARVREDLEHKGSRSWRMNEFDRWIVFYGVRDHVATVYRVGSGTMSRLALRFA